MLDLVAHDLRLGFVFGTCTIVVATPVGALAAAAVVATARCAAPCAAAIAAILLFVVLIILGRFCFLFRVNAPRCWKRQPKRSEQSIAFRRAAEGGHRRPDDRNRNQRQRSHTGVEHASQRIELVVRKKALANACATQWKCETTDAGSVQETIARPRGSDLLGVEQQRFQLSLKEEFL